MESRRQLAQFRLPSGHNPVRPMVCKPSGGLSFAKRLVAPWRGSQRKDRRAAASPFLRSIPD